MTLSSGILACSKKHDHRVLICNSYLVDLYLAWSIELFWRLKTNSVSKIDFINLSSYSLDKQLKLLALIKRTLLRKNKLENLVASNYLPGANSLKDFNKLTILIAFSKSVFKSFLLAPKVLLAQDSSQFVSIRTSQVDVLKACHTTLAGKLGTTEYYPRRYIFTLFAYSTSFYALKDLIAKLICEENYCQIVVGNGRLLNSAAALSALENTSVKRLIVERGSKPGKLDTYLISPHSIKERRAHISAAWSSADYKNRESVAIEYLEIRRKQDPISGIMWTKSQRSGEVPEIPEGFKVCVFYTSTELEFAVFHDPIDKSMFQTQRDALYALLTVLNPSDWIVFLRRHPYAKFNRRDPEAKLWHEFSKFNNLRVIQPNSSVDSYALGARAHLIVHYNSSIGPELIYQQTCPVLTTGNSPWEKTYSPYLLHNRDELAEYLKHPGETRPKRDAFEWAYYQSVFGEEFKCVTWLNQRGFVNGLSLLERKK